MEKELTGQLVNEDYINRQWDTIKTGLPYDYPEEAIQGMYKDLSHLVMCFNRLANALTSGMIGRMLDILYWIHMEYFKAYEEWAVLMDEDGLQGMRELYTVILEAVKMTMVYMAGQVQQGFIDYEDYTNLTMHLNARFAEQDINEADWVLKSILAEGIYTEFVQIYSEDIQTGERTDFPNIRIAALEYKGED